MITLVHYATVISTRTGLAIKPKPGQKVRHRPVDPTPNPTYHPPAVRPATLLLIQIQNRDGGCTLLLGFLPAVVEKARIPSSNYSLYQTTMRHSGFVAVCI